MFTSDITFCLNEFPGIDCVVCEKILSDLEKNNSMYGEIIACLIEYVEDYLQAVFDFMMLEISNVYIEKNKVYFTVAVKISDVFTIHRDVCTCAKATFLTWITSTAAKDKFGNFVTLDKFLTNLQGRDVEGALIVYSNYVLDMLIDTDIVEFAKSDLLLNYNTVRLSVGGGV